MGQSAILLLPSFFSVWHVKQGDAHGLVECFKAAVKFVGVNDWQEKSIGLGCDGTNVDVL